MDSSLKEDCYQITTSVNESQVQGSTQLVTRPAANTSSMPDSSQSPALLEASLPPVDKGFHAYSYLAAGFIIEFLVWSLPFSYGVFLNHYTTHRLFDHSENLLPLVGTLSSGILYMASLFILPASAQYPAYRKGLMCAGLLLCVSALLGAAFATQVWHLILTQGVLYSIGGTLLYFPMTVSVFEWFDKKRGLLKLVSNPKANGIMYSGTFLGGTVMPFIIEVLLNKFGLRVTFASLATVYAILIASVLPFVKSRIPPSAMTAPDTPDWSFLRNPKFIILVSGNFLQGLGNFIPPLWLPTFATDLKMSVTTGTLVVSLMNASGIPGCIILGHLADKYDLRIIMLVSIIGSSLPVLLLWGLASTLPPLLVFALIYGSLAAP
ncbi:hypothetical protein FRC08_011912 [Ceratobasidium sp. 394]|nr:hypothetical protein FRC08_011912 [Ceratobasidium sp. 394]